jgi:DNA mismatch repair protein PMS2
MRILGQFNLGFIVAEHKDDLYILDQHACDEKYNFETLQLNTVIHQQPLIAPVNLDLTCAEELVVAEHLDVFAANGFKIDTDINRPPGSRVRLLAVPYSKGIQFGVDDVRELASMLSGEFEGYADTARADIEIRNEKLPISKDVPASQTSNPSSSSSLSSNSTLRSPLASRLRLPKLVSMFASRACRMSVMIGKALTTSDMVGITRRLSTISQPWNCPHGRPTMRHLVDYKKLWTSRVRAFADEYSNTKE